MDDTKEGLKMDGCEEAAPRRSMGEAEVEIERLRSDLDRATQLIEEMSAVDVVDRANKRIGFCIILMFVVWAVLLKWLGVDKDNPVIQLIVWPVLIVSMHSIYVSMVNDQSASKEKRWKEAGR